jgi:hypothetical protein
MLLQPLLPNLLLLPKVPLPHNLLQLQPVKLRRQLNLPLFQLL